MLFELAEKTKTAGVFTLNAFCAAPVMVARRHIAAMSPRYLLINTGNANAGTGVQGERDAIACCEAVARECGVNAEQVLPFSTGVIGELLPVDKIVGALPAAHKALAVDQIAAAARGIMTTDTRPKMVSRQVMVEGHQVTISGIAKGSGMIAPDMATMLVYIFTDAKIGQEGLQTLLAQHNENTFNCITVDSDTSTSDSVMIAATGASGVDVMGNTEFADALHKVMLDLAHQVVRDGEGATKFVSVNVSGAANNADARLVGMAIANSPLVKTAIAGEDPNWGRIVMAVGKSGAQADRDLLTIRFGDILVAQEGWVAPSYTEDAGAYYMRGQDIAININLGLGAGTCTVWTCDLPHQYITINADYRS